MPGLLSISSKEIASLDEAAFPEFMKELLDAERARTDPENGVVEVPASVERHVRDKGEDGTTISDVEGRLIPKGKCVWQFKSGPLGPRDVEKAAKAPRVEALLKAGGSFRLANAKDYVGEALASRKAALDSALRDMRVEPSRAKFLPANEIEPHAARHPALALMRVFGRPIGDLVRADTWNLQRGLELEWFEDEERHKIAQAIRQDLRASNGLLHVRICGNAGVGKTRLALETLRQQDLSPKVIYARWLEALPPGLFAWFAEHELANAILVIDEVQSMDVQRLGDLAAVSGGRLQLLTIGPGGDVPPGVRVFELNPLGSAAAERLVRSVSDRRLSDDLVRWIVVQTKGYVKLAVEIVKILVKTSGIDSVTKVVGSGAVRSLLQAMIPNETERKTATAISLGMRVGWEGSLEREGKAFCRCVGIKWPDAQRAAAALVERGLVAPLGRYRHVTPHLLAVWLALQEWRARPMDIVKELVGDMHSPESRRAVLRRLASLGNDVAAKEVITWLLSKEGLFADVDGIDGEVGSEVLGILADGLPQAGLWALERLIGGLPHDRLLAFRRGRRHVVWALHRLAKQPGLFTRSAGLLLALAEAENESWSNNATRAWESLFQTHLGMPQTPAQERHKVLDEALRSEAVARRKLAVRGIRAALRLYEVGESTAPEPGWEFPVRCWRPATEEEDTEASTSALRLLQRAVQDANPEVRALAVQCLADSTFGIAVVDLLGELLGVVKKSELTWRERRLVRENLEDLIKLHKLAPQGEQGRQLNAVVDSLTGSSYGDRIRRWTGRWSSSHLIEATGEEKAQCEVAALAAEGFRNPSALQAELGWLVSTEAYNADRLGMRLGELDKSRTWLDRLVAATVGADNTRLLSGYLSGLSQSGQQAFVAEMLDGWANEGEGKCQLVFECTRQVDPTPRGAERLLKLVERGWLKPIVLGELAVGGWIVEQEAKSAAGVMRASLADGTVSGARTALSLLTQRLALKPDEADDFRDVAWQALAISGTTAGPGLSRDDWGQVGLAFVGEDPVRMAELVFHQYEEKDHPHGADDPVNRVLTRAVELEPHGVTSKYLQRLAVCGEPARSLQFGTERWLAPLLNVEELVSWAKKRGPSGSQLLAAIAPVSGDQLDPLSARLLREFGDERGVREILSSVFVSGTFSGKRSDWLRARLSLAENWAQADEPNQRSWALQLVGELEERIRCAELGEAEDPFWNPSDA